MERVYPDPENGKLRLRKLGEENGKKEKGDGKELEGNWRDETDKEKRSKRNEMFLKRCFLRTYDGGAVEEGYSFISLKFSLENND
jgi:hypothetical protein